MAAGQTEAMGETAGRFGNAGEGQGQTQDERGGTEADHSQIGFGIGILVAAFGFWSGHMWVIAAGGGGFLYGLFTAWMRPKLALSKRFATHVRAQSESGTGVTWYDGLL